MEADFAGEDRRGEILRTVPPLATASSNTENPQPGTRSSSACSGQPKRRSGLSEP